MKALAYLLGARALDAAAAADAANQRIARPEPALPPIATSPEGAAAWRRWAQAGREERALPATPRTGVPATASGRTG
ncbi:MAG TPA: hypothetical protein VIK65_12780 [Candidatus Limnocylindrales bacterium]|jgi:hypothetical protein